MTESGRKAPGGVPSYVLQHAPLIHLSSKDPYFPSSPAATLTSTRPQIAYKDTPIPSPPLTLLNLDQLNNVGDKGGADIYLTSNQDVSKDPAWLKGEKVGADGGTERETGVVIVVDKGNGVVDAFYFVFWAFNWGGVVLGNQLGDHVGDWEHNMIRFINGEPKYVWCSQHANGEAFAFSALKKDSSGKRPLVYAANGSHAIFASPGLHDHTIPNLNLPTPFLLVDETDAGPLYDPVLSSYFYTYTPSSNTVAPYPSDSPAPTAYLYFKGRWGDEEYPESDARQKALLGNKKYVGGPTGPLDKQLGRKEVWPESKWSKGQRIRKSLGPSLFEGLKEKLNCFGKKETTVKKVLVSGEPVA